MSAPVSPPTPVLARGTHTRDSTPRGDTDALAALWSSPRARVLLLSPELTAPLAGGGLRLTAADGELPADALLLGRDDDADYFALRVGADDPRLAGSRLAGLRDAGALLPDTDAGLLVHAVALAGWHASHAHCPRCGTPTAPSPGGATRVCPADASVHFPRTDPAVIMLVTSPDGEAAIVGRQPSWPARRFSCLAGFVEPGESLEAAVLREVAEEVGVAARDPRYVASQPWPFPASLMVGFRAVTADTTLDVGADELAEARWVRRDEVLALHDSGEVLLPPPVSIARLLIDTWAAGH